MLDVRRLRLLRELSLRGTLAAVAEALHQSPSSVSQQLAQLEREAGIPLLRKVGRGVQLTPAATALAERAGDVLDLLEQAEAEVGLFGDQATGTVRLAAFQSAALAFMPQLLADLARRHPQVRVTMSQRLPEEALEDLHTRELDLVIAVEYPGHLAPRPAALDHVPLTSDTVRLAVPVRGPLSRVRDVAAAARAPWVMEPRPAPSRGFAEQTCRAAGFEPEVRYESDDLETHLALVESGNAVAVVPGLMVLRRRHDVRLIDLPGDARRSVFTVTRRAIAETPAVRAVRETLSAVVPERLDQRTPRRQAPAPTVRG